MALVALAVSGTARAETLAGALRPGSRRAEEISARVWQALERAELADVATELAANLSYGKRKYLEIARALADLWRVYWDIPKAVSCAGP